MTPRILRRLRSAASERAGDSTPAPPAGEHGPAMVAKLTGGPQSGRTIEVSAVEGRPPKTVDVDGAGGVRSRYVLAEWEQSGHSADYSFLYDV